MQPNVLQDNRTKYVGGTGPTSYYKVKGYRDAVIQHDASREHNPWAVIAVSDGKTLPGSCPIYPTSREAISAIINGTWRD